MNTNASIRALLAVVAAMAAVLVLAPATAAATFVVNTVDDLNDGVCSTAHCSLREAIQAANATTGHDFIAFNIPGPPPHSIKPLTQLPPTTSPVTIDGLTEPDYAGSPVVELDGTFAVGATSGLIINGSNSVVRGLVINRFGPTLNVMSGGILVNVGGNNVFEGNYIGTDVTGTLPFGNRAGVALGGTGGNLVGGTTLAARNVISANNGPNGAGVFTVSPGNIIRGNYIGTDVTGTFALPNVQGVAITGSNNIVGGTAAGAGNLISGNTQVGLQICANCGAFPTAGNVVQGNYIGTDASGMNAVPNQDAFGAAVLVRAPNNIIGGTGNGAGNVISGNVGAGIAIGFLFSSIAAASDNLVAGNLIGVAADGVQPLGNTGHGVHVGFANSTLPAVRNTIGGTQNGAPNRIANNRAAGVFVEPTSSQNAILMNAIYANRQLGIDLSPIGPTPNDPGDADLGANELQNYPVLNSVSTGPSGTNASGVLSSKPNTTYRLEFFSNDLCDPSGFGEGQDFIGARDVTTNGSGTAVFSFALGSSDPGDAITATATDPLNNTSEFSNCRTVQTGAGPPATLDLQPGADENPVGTQHCVTATVRDAFGIPVPNVLVRFTVTGVNTRTASARTDAGGVATFCYTGTIVGQDVIRAYADTDEDNVQDSTEPTGVATKTWGPAAPAAVVVDPPTDTNTVGDQHCVSAQVVDAFGNPVPNQSVRFRVTGANQAAGSDTTGSDGRADFCYVGTAPGEDVITAYVDSDNDSTQDPSEPSGGATKTWLPGNPVLVIIDPPAAENPVGSQHCVTATATDTFGNPTPNETIRFAVTGANTASGAAQTDGSGRAQFCYVGHNVGEDVITAYADNDNDNQQDPDEARGIAAKTWQPGAPATVGLTPPAAENPVGTEHCVTATVRDAFGNPVPGVTIRFEVTGSVTRAGTRATDENGQAVFCYTGPNTPGADVITAYSDTDNDNQRDANEPQGVAEKTWVAAGPQFVILTPPTAENPVGVEHCVLAQVTDAFGNEAPNVSVRFAVTGANARSGVETTDSTGKARFCYTGTVSGLDTITAYADSDRDGQQDTNEPSGEATKLWQPGDPATVAVTPPADENVVGTEHCVSAVVRDAFGNAVPDETVYFEVAGANPANGADDTDSSGRAEFCYTGTRTGEDVITAYADNDGDGQRDPADPSGEATKTWLAGEPATLTLSPKADENPVGTQHCVHGEVQDAFGNVVPGVTVNFQVQGAVQTSGSAETSEAGVATFCYDGPELAGADVIRAYVDKDDDDTQDPDEPQDVAEKTWRPPASTPGCEVTITNGGWIHTTTGSRGTFGGNARAEHDGTARGQEEYHDHGIDLNFHSNEIVSIACNADRTQADIYGTGTIDGAGSVEFRIRVRDLDEPGSHGGPDTYQILAGTYVSGPEDNPLEGGNIQIHDFS